MKRRFFGTGLAAALVIAAAPMAVAVEPAVPGVALVRTAAADTYLTGPLAGATDAHASERTIQAGNDATTRRALLRFDLGVPDSAVVRRAVLRLAVTEAPVAPVRIEARAPGATWTGAATWRTSDGTTPWPGEGGAPGTTAYAVATVSAAGAAEWDVTALAQTWVAGANTGVLLQATGDSLPGGASFGASEHPKAEKRPVLDVVYVAPPDPVGNLVATAHDNEVRATWDAPFAHGEPVTRYLVRLLGREGGIVAEAETTRRFFRFPSAPNGRDYAVEVFARNAIGTSEGARSAYVTPAGSSTAPEGLALARGVRSIVANWQPPDYGNPTSYLATATRTSDGEVVSELETTELTATLAGLETGVGYLVSVQGRNAVGLGLATRLYGEPAGLPGAPGSPSVAAVRGGDAVDVTWLAAAPNGSPVTAYVVTASLADTTVARQVDVSGDTLAATVDGLDPHTDYVVSVMARNGVGDSPAATATVRTRGELPHAPVITGITQSSPRSLTLRWAPPPAGPTFDNYFARVTRESDGALVTEALLPATASEQGFGNLDGGVSYCFALVASNGEGSGPADTECAVAGDVPSPATGVSVMPGDYQATVAWEAAVPRGTPVTGYRVRLRPSWASPDSDVWDVTREVDAGALTATVDGLEGRTRYTARVEALSALGGSPSEWVATQVGPLPAPVTDLVVVPLDGALDISWRVTDDPAQRAEAYVVEVYEQGGQYPVVTEGYHPHARRFALTNLRNGVPHRVVLAARSGEVSTDVEATATPSLGNAGRLDEISLYGGATNLLSNYDNGRIAWIENGRWRVHDAVGDTYDQYPRVLASTVEPREYGWPLSARRVVMVGSDPGFDTDEALARGDTNGISDVYFFLSSYGLRPASAPEGSSGVGNGASHSAAVAWARSPYSWNQYYVAFRSEATNLDSDGGAPDTNGREDVYLSLLDGDTGDVWYSWRASVTEHGELDGGSIVGTPAVNSAGAVAFEHTGADSSGVDTNGTGDVYVLDADLYLPEARSRPLLPGRANGTHDPQVSWENGYVLFRAERAPGEPPIAAGDSEGVPAWYRHHLESGTTELVASGDVTNVRISPRGELVTFVRDGALWLRDFTAGTERLVVGAEWQPVTGYTDWNTDGSRRRSVVWLGRDPALPGLSVRRTWIS